MAAGELNLQLTPDPSQAEASSQVGRELPPLPPELESIGLNLIRALEQDQQVAQTFATFCSEAYVKPEWAGAASEFLADLFAHHEDLLAELTRIPDLIIELGSGHVTLTCMVAARWAARGETHRLARLAEALIATQSKMSGTVAVTEVMLALATSLAITRYSRAEQLLHAAEPQVKEDQHEALAEARLWLGAGRIVRGCSQEIRDLWDQRLRRSRQTWNWESPEEREALLQLADNFDDNLEGLSLFEPVVPTAWWDLAIFQAKKQKDSPLAATATAPASAAALNGGDGVNAPTGDYSPIASSLPPHARAGTGTSYADAPDYDALPPDTAWSPKVFFAGALLGALSFFAFTYLLQPAWISRQRTVLAASVKAAPASTQAPSPIVTPQNGTPDQEDASGPKLNLVPSGEAEIAPAASTSTSTDSTSTPVPAGNTASPSVAATSPATAPAMEQPQQPLSAAAIEAEEWRKGALKELAEDVPELAPLVNAAKHGTWEENQAVLKGETMSAPRILTVYQKLLVWLHLDPPETPEVRAKIPGLLAEVRTDDSLLELWKKLTYEGSLNAADIRNAARYQLETNSRIWTTDQQKMLKEIATEEPSPSIPAQE